MYIREIIARNKSTLLVILILSYSSNACNFTNYPRSSNYPEKFIKLQQYYFDRYNNVLYKKYIAENKKIYDYFRIDTNRVNKCVWIQITSYDGSNINNGVIIINDTIKCQYSARYVSEKHNRRVFKVEEQKGGFSTREQDTLVYFINRREYDGLLEFAIGERKKNDYSTIYEIYSIDISDEIEYKHLSPVYFELFE